jgi:hypothetical protein
MYQGQLELDTIGHVASLHKGGSCSMPFKLQNGEWCEPVAKPFGEILQDINVLGDSEKIDMFISQQCVLPYKNRCVANIYSISTFWVDIDCYNVGLNQEQAINEAFRIIEDLGLPSPRMVAYSGRGIYLVWQLEKPISLTKSIKNKNERIASWQALEDLLIKAFDSIGADSRSSDLARVLRVAGSVNSKANNTVKYWLSGNKLKSFDDLKKPLIKLFPSKPKNTQKSYKLAKVTNLYEYKKTRYTLAQCRMADLETLAKLRGGVYTDYRERAIYAFAVEASYFCRERVTLINTIKNFMINCIYLGDNKYQVDKADKIVKSVIDRCEKANYATPTFKGDERYKHKTGTLIDLLGITEREQRKLKVIISKSVKYERKKTKRQLNGILEREKYEANRQAEKDARKKRAIELRRKGYTIQQIANEMGVSGRTVLRYF